MNAPPRGRLAPSPTGYLHLGNAWAFLWAWAACRSQCGTLVLRMDDIDPARSRPVYAEAAVEDLHWLGLNWDEGPDIGGPHAPYVQSERIPFYHAYLQRLVASIQAYPCYCTRKELRLLAGAPHVGDTGAPYPGTCRNLTQKQREAHEMAGRRPCLRLCCPERSYTFTDTIQGTVCMTLEQCGGDFALQRSDGVVAYQLATVVDDADMEISQVVRGEDILPSTPRQLALCDVLHLLPPQEYMHIPLLCAPDGERLAKRHGSLALRALREHGVAPDALVGYLSYKAGLCERPCRLPLPDLLTRFSPSCLKALPQPLCIEPDLVEKLVTLDP